jgi:hypothetical protein
VLEYAAALLQTLKKGRKKKVCWEKAQAEMT